MKRLGKVVMRQEDVVVWHAKIQQIRDAVTYMSERQGEIGPEEGTELFDEMLADLDSFKSKLPPIQTRFPF